MTMSSALGGAVACLKADGAGRRDDDNPLAPCIGVGLQREISIDITLQDWYPYKTIST